MKAKSDSNNIPNNKSDGKITMFPVKYLVFAVDEDGDIILQLLWTGYNIDDKANKPNIEEAIMELIGLIHEDIVDDIPTSEIFHDLEDNGFEVMTYKDGMDILNAEKIIIEIDFN